MCSLQQKQWIRVNMFSIIEENYILISFRVVAKLFGFFLIRTSHNLSLTVKMGDSFFPDNSVIRFLLWIKMKRGKTDCPWSVSRVISALNYNSGWNIRQQCACRANHFAFHKWISCDIFSDFFWKEAAPIKKEESDNKRKIWV